ncbi:MAG: MarR family winged helix-turn-helix transcriptional regulator [Candidatus Bipolaricaulota bacterium]|nr:MarR family winged helix-turn-helix transcriptional regulator [Candidatus Bipolaricaulota bacterium]
MGKEGSHDPIGYLLAQVCKLSRDRSRALMGGIGLYCGQGIALQQLWRKDGITQSELAHGLRVAPATVTISLQRMEKLGLIERRPDPHDQRGSRVFLTEKGRSLRERVEGNWHKLEGQALAGFTEGDRTLLRQFLSRIRANLGQTKIQ